MPHQQEWVDKEGRELPRPEFVTVEPMAGQTRAEAFHKAAEKAGVGPELQRVQCNALVDDSHKYTDVLSQGADGLVYAVRTKDGREVARVVFHEGPLAGADAGEINGVMIENLLAICKDRLRVHQESKFACSENEIALMHIKSAVGCLKSRTASREARKVEGTHEL